MRWSAGILLVVVAIGAARPAAAQSDRLYAGASAIVSTQGSNRPGTSPDFPTSGVGGTSFGVSGEFGGQLTPALGLSVEVAVPARFESIQETDYSLTFRTISRHRDLTFSGLFHANLYNARSISVTLVVGPTLVHEDTLQSTAYQVSTPGSYPIVFGAYGPEIPLTRWSVGVTVGGDVAVRIARRVELVPQIRVHVISRQDDPGAGLSAFLGLSSVVVRPAVGLRVSF